LKRGREMGHAVYDARTYPFALTKGGPAHAVPAQNMTAIKLTDRLRAPDLTNDLLLPTRPPFCSRSNY
jgi:hypothetical protein